MTDTLLPRDPGLAAAKPVVSEDMRRRARRENLLGLFTPVANLGMRHTAPKNLRWFGVGAGVVLLAFAAWQLWHGRETAAVVALAIHGALALGGILDPALPELAGRAWHGIGRVLEKVVSIPLLVLIYLVVVTPIALLARLCGSDPLRRKVPRGDSYWHKREPAAKDRFERQF